MNKVLDLSEFPIGFIAFIKELDPSLTWLSSLSALYDLLSFSKIGFSTFLEVRPNQSPLWLTHAWLNTYGFAALLEFTLNFLSLNVDWFFSGIDDELFLSKTKDFTSNRKVIKLGGDPKNTGELLHLQVWPINQISSIGSKTCFVTVKSSFDCVTIGRMTLTEDTIGLTLFSIIIKASMVCA